LTPDEDFHPWASPENFWFGKQFPTQLRRQKRSPISFSETPKNQVMKPLHEEHRTHPHFLRIPMFAP